MIPLGLFQDTGANVIDVDGTQTNLNLKDFFELSFPPAISGDVVTFNVLGTAVIRSAEANLPSMQVGLWAAGVDVRVNNASSDWRGAGGDAGTGNASDPPNFTPAEDGGTALLVDYPITLDNSGGRIAGGGGGGGGGIGTGPTPPSTSGGGGAGDDGGTGEFGKAGLETGGSPGIAAGSGGALGQPGNNGNNGPGGAAGLSIDGTSNVTFIDAGSLVGPTAA